MSARAAAPTFGSNVHPEAALSDQFDFTTLYDEFRDEGRQQLARLDAALLHVEEAGALPEEEGAALLRALHTLKGNSGMLGLSRVVDAVHAVETVFKSEPAHWPQPLVDSLFEAAAALRRAVDRLGSEQQEEALARVAALSIPDAARASEDVGAPSAGPVVEPARRTPTLEPPEDAAAPADLAGTPDGAGEVLRVPFAKLDALLNQVGELVSAGAAVEALAERYRTELEAIGAWRPLDHEVEVLQRVTESVRAATMELRLVPVGRVLGRFPSLARELARAEGKRVRVALEGEGVELDKSTVDALSEPLLHLVRNAVDHGIEPPAVREARGKEPTGNLVLRASREGDRVRIEVADDGAGLDRSAIVERGRALGLLEPEEQPDQAAVAELIFRPGFSTRASATTVSGRGVGMDVVRRRVSALRGTLTVEDRPGGGTRFVLWLPLTLAIVPALVFETDGATLALAATDVEETLRRVSPQRAGRAEVIRHGGALLPIARPARLFGWETETTDAPRRFAIVLRSGMRAAAVVAERIVGQRDIVVKALPRYIGALPGVSGATVTPEGQVILLLDAAGLLDLNLETHRRESRAD